MSNPLKNVNENDIFSYELFVLTLSLQKIIIVKIKIAVTSLYFAKLFN